MPYGEAPDGFMEFAPDLAVEIIFLFRSLLEAVTYQPEDELDLSDILPSFRRRVSELFGKKGRQLPLIL